MVLYLYMAKFFMAKIQLFTVLPKTKKSQCILFQGLQQWTGPCRRYSSKINPCVNSYHPPSLLEKSQQASVDTSFISLFIMKYYCISLQKLCGKKGDAG